MYTVVPQAMSIDSSLSISFYDEKYVGCQSSDVTITFGMMIVFAKISFFFQSHTITTDPIQPLTRISGFLG